ACWRTPVLNRRQHQTVCHGTPWREWLISTGRRHAADDDQGRITDRVTRRRGNSGQYVRAAQMTSTHPVASRIASADNTRPSRLNTTSKSISTVLRSNPIFRFHYTRRFIRRIISLWIGPICKGIIETDRRAWQLPDLGSPRNRLSGSARHARPAQA
ncbi:unnamed protein product, partial [marine sediment metagenome]